MNETPDPSKDDQQLNEVVNAAARFSKGKLLAGGAAAAYLLAGIHAVVAAPETPHPAATSREAGPTGAASAAPSPMARPKVLPTATALPETAGSSPAAVPAPPPEARPHAEQLPDWSSMMGRLGADLATDIEQTAGTRDWHRSGGTNQAYPGSRLEIFTRPAPVNNPDYSGEYMYGITRDPSGRLLEVSVKEAVIPRHGTGPTTTLDRAFIRLEGKAWIGYYVHHTGTGPDITAFAPAHIRPAEAADTVLALDAGTFSMLQQASGRLYERGAAPQAQPLVFPAR